jgi:hypothetical protein
MLGMKLSPNNPLRRPGYRFFMLFHVATSIGGGFHFVASHWVLYDDTKSPASTAWLVLSYLNAALAIASLLRGAGGSLQPSKGIVALDLLCLGFGLPAYRDDCLGSFSPFSLICLRGTDELGEHPVLDNFARIFERALVEGRTATCQQSQHGSHARRIPYGGRVGGNVVRAPWRHRFLFHGGGGVCGSRIRLGFYSSMVSRSPAQTQRSYWVSELF